jgi:hypothetical protein
MLRWGALIGAAGLLLLGSVLLWTSSSRAQTTATVWWDTGMAKLRKNNKDVDINGNGGIDVGTGDPIPADRKTGPIDISAARNEFEPFQIFVAAGTASVTGVNVAVTDLTDGRGGIIAASNTNGTPRNVVIYREHYLRVAPVPAPTCSPTPTPGFNYPSNLNGKLGWTPDALVPKVDEYFGEVRRMPGETAAAFPFNVNADEKQGIWVDVYVPQGTHAGLYTGTVTVTNTAGTLATFPLNLQVRDFELPSTPSLKTAYSVNMGSTGITRGHFQAGADETNPAHHELACLYNKEMLLHRLSNETIVWPLPKWNDATQQINWPTPPQPVSTFCPQEYGDFLTGNDPNLLPSGKLPGAKMTRARLREDRTWMGQTLDHAARTNTPPQGVTPGYGSLANYKNYLNQYNAQFQAQGWGPQLFHYIWDEPTYRPIETFNATDPKVWRCDSAWGVRISKDTFNRGTAGVGTALGTNWQDISGLDIFNNEVRSNAANAGTAVFDEEYTQTNSCTGASTQIQVDLGVNQVVSAKCKMTANGNACGLMARWSDANNYYYARLDAGQDNVVLFRRQAGAATLLGSVPVTLSLNTYYRLRLVVQGVKEQGVSLWVYVDTDPANPATSPAIALIDPISSTSPLNGGNFVGLWSWSTGSGAVTFDDFSANKASNHWAGLYAKARWFKDNGVAVPVLLTTSSEAVGACIGGQIKDPSWRSLIDFYVVANKQMHGKPSDQSCASGQFDVASDPPFNQNLRGDYDSSILTPGKELWWYHACGNHGCGDSCETEMVTPMADLPNTSSRLFEWLTYRYQINSDVNPATAYPTAGPQTELYYEVTYAYDQWNGTAATDPWTKIDYFTGVGDGTLFYPGRPDAIGGTHHIPVASIRLNMLREANEDYEYLLLAETKKQQQGFDGKGWIYNNILLPYLGANDPRDGLQKFITYVWNKDPGSPTAATGVLRAREELAKVLAPDFADNFDRANSSAFGSNWTESLPDLEIFSNQVRTINTGNKEALFIPSVGADQDVSALIKMTATGNSGAVIARRVDANNFYRARLDVAAGNIALYKTAGGTSTLLGTVAARPLSYNTYYKVRLVVKGSSLKVYFNYETTPAITATDSSFASGGTGMRAFTTAANTIGYDNFALTKALQ